MNASVNSPSASAGRSEPLGCESNTGEEPQWTSRYAPVPSPTLSGAEPSATRRSRRSTIAIIPSGLSLAPGGRGFDGEAVLPRELLCGGRRARGPIVGSVFLDERSAIASVASITVDPAGNIGLKDILKR